MMLLRKTYAKAIATLVRNALTMALVIFVVLKIVGHIAWSWWWVTAPFWIPCAAALVALGVSLALRRLRKGRKS